MYQVHRFRWQVSKKISMVTIRDPRIGRKVNMKKEEPRRCKDPNARMPVILLALILPQCFCYISGCGSEKDQSCCMPLDPERAKACAMVLVGRPTAERDHSVGQVSLQPLYPSPADLGMDFRPVEHALSGHSATTTTDMLKAMVDHYVVRVVSLTAAPFEWSRAHPDVLCAAIESRSPSMWITAEQPSDLDKVLREVAHVLGYQPEVQWRNDRIGSVRMRAPSCTCLEAMRSLKGISAIDISWPLDLHAANVTSPTIPRSLTYAPQGHLDPFNPGLYDPRIHGSYVEYIRQRSPFDATIMDHHRMTDVFQRYGVPSRPAIGIAVLDNGVLPEWVDDYATGHGRFRIEGHHRDTRTGQIDGPYPLRSDFFGLSFLIPYSFDHGTRQLGHVQCFAPHATRASKRAASIVFLLLEEDFDGVVDAIEAVAEDPELHVISMSMGTLFYSAPIESAIAHLNRRGKLLVAAAGTFPVPAIRDLLPVVFPAHLASTVSVTGIEDPQNTGGAFVLGSESVGGPENDFVTDTSPASSEATSTMAATIATIWALEPTRSREEVLAALVASSTFFKERRTKHPVFGWGKIDALEAASIVRRELPLPKELEVCERVCR